MGPVRTRTQHRTARSRPPFRPALLVLEDRTAPAVLTVTNLSDHDPGSLRAELAAAADGDTVQFQTGLSGTITLTTGQLPVVHSVTVQGPGVAALTVSGHNAVRVFEVFAGASATLRDLTIADGKAENNRSDVYGTYGEGGGIRVDAGASLSLGSCLVRDCTATASGANSTQFQYNHGHGGGVASYGTLSVANSTFRGNVASVLTGFTIAEGGGIYNHGTLTVTGSLIADNSASAAQPEAFGGGIANDYQAPATVRTSTFTGNMALASVSHGGAISTYQGPLTVADCTFASNTAASSGSDLDIGSGGGIYSNSSALTVTGSTFSVNSASATGTNVAEAEGGAIDGAAGSLTLTNCTLSFNTAHGVFTSQSFGASGGGINFFGGPLVIASSTISDNSSVGGSSTSSYSGGGGLWSNVGSTEVQLVNTIVAGNSSGGGPNADIRGNLDTTVSRYNLIGPGGSGGLVNGVNGNLVGVANPMLVPLDDNGGPTPTRKPLAGSAAIGVGDPSLFGTPDQRRILRDLPVTIGAYQDQGPARYFELDPPASVVAGAPFAVTVSARDLFGQVETGYTGTVYLNSTDPQNPNLDGHVFTAADHGSYTFSSEQLFSAGDQVLEARAADIGGGSADVAVVPAAPAFLYLVVDPSVFAGVTPGAPFTVTAYLYDAYSNRVTNFTGRLHFAGSDPAAALPADYPFTAADAGSHTFTLTLNTPGPASVTASVVGSPGVSFELDLFVL